MKKGKKGQKHAFSLWTTKEMAERIEQLAKQKKTSKSEAVRTCLAFSLKNLYEDK